MAKKWIIFCVFLFIAGLALGVLEKTMLEAADPMVPIHDGPQSLAYDEFWEAIGAYVTDGATGRYREYEEGGIPRSALSLDIPDVGRVAVDVVTRQAFLETAPDLIVGQWRVHGHIHFK